mgnify:FL=1
MSEATDIPIDIPETIKINPKHLKRMVFVMNALERGWSVKKVEDEYIFTKKHENKREIFRENYLETFIQTNFDMDILQKK